MRPLVFASNVLFDTRAPERVRHGDVCLVLGVDRETGSSAHPKRAFVPWAHYNLLNLTTGELATLYLPANLASTRSVSVLVWV